MATTWRTSTETVTSANISSFTISEPTGIKPGDFEFVIVSCPTGATVTTPSGWTLHGSAAGTNANFFVFYVTRGRGQSPPTLVFSCTNGAALTYEWHALAVGGVDTSIDVSVSTTLGSRTNPDCPSATAVHMPDEAVAIGFNWTGSGGGGWAHASYTIRSVNTAGLDSVVASKSLTAAGAEDPAAFTGGGGANDTWEITLLLNPPMQAVKRPVKPFFFKPTSSRQN